ncbi:MAG: DNA repair protein RecO [Candidatus Kerfeldbacteria bacterium]
MANLTHRTGIILNRRNVGAHDRRITFFCVDGKHELRARGTQKFESKLAGSLEPLTLVEVTTVGGRSGEQVTGSTIRDSFRHLRSSVAKMAAAGLIVSSVDVTIHGIHDDTVLYRRIRESIVLIQRSTTNRSLFLSVAFGLWNLVALSGYTPLPDIGRRKKTPVDRLVAVLLQGDPRLMRRIVCSVHTARLCVTAALRQIERIAERDVPAERFFSYALR